MKEIDTNTEAISFELEGKVFLVRRGTDGSILAREELDGQLMLNVLLEMFSDASENYLPLELLEFVDQSKDS